MNGGLTVQLECINGGQGRGSVVMRLHVTMEVPRLRKAQVADLATVGLLSRVDALVLGECACVREALSAVVTAIWSLPRVGSKVGGHGRAL